jgi:hypothetical protein
MSARNILEFLTTSNLIFHYLASTSLYSLALTCKDMYRLVNDNGTCISVNDLGAYKFWRTSIWSKEMNISMYRGILPYDIVFDIPASTCRYCGGKGDENDCKLFATGWIVNESLPNDTVIQKVGIIEKLKKGLRLLLMTFFAICHIFMSAFRFVESVSNDGTQCYEQDDASTIWLFQFLF